MSGKRTTTGRELSDSDYQRLAQFRYALRHFLHFSDEKAREEGLNPQQYQALIVVRGFDGAGPPTVGDLAKMLLIEHHSAVGLVDRLAAAGLLIRKRETEDGRRVSLMLTERACELLSGLAAAHRNELRRLVPLMKPIITQLQTPKSGKVRNGE